MSESFLSPYICRYAVRIVRTAEVCLVSRSFPDQWSFAKLAALHRNSLPKKWCCGTIVTKNRTTAQSGKYCRHCSIKFHNQPLTEKLRFLESRDKSPLLKCRTADTSDRQDWETIAQQTLEGTLPQKISELRLPAFACCTSKGSYAGSPPLRAFVGSWRKAPAVLSPVIQKR
jgi:hypothetical protein